MSKAALRKWKQVSGSKRRVRAGAGARYAVKGDHLGGEDLVSVFLRFLDPTGRGDRATGKGRVARDYFFHLVRGVERPLHDEVDGGWAVWILSGRHGRGKYEGVCWPVLSAREEA